MFLIENNQKNKLYAYQFLSSETVRQFCLKIP